MNPSVITEGTLLPLGLVIMCGTVLVALGVAIHEFRSMKRSIVAIKRSLIAREQMQYWMGEMQRANGAQITWVPFPPSGTYMTDVSGDE